MKYFYSCLLTLIIQSSFAQIQRAFITKDGKFSNNPKRAVSYILIKKLDIDSAYKVNQYDMHDTIMVSGMYKDESLTIPNGKFTYYYKARLPKNANKKIAPRIDTNNYVQLVGVFLNGKREGKWIGYSARGTISDEYIFEHGRLNGPIKSYYVGSLGYRAEGTMINDTLEGKYYMYRADSLLIAEFDYLHGKEINRVTHFHQATERPTFDSYLERNLKKYRKQLSAMAPVVEFTISKTGTITNPKIVKGINPDVDKAILAVLPDAPSYIPANYDYQPMEQKITTSLALFKEPTYFYVQPFPEYTPRPRIPVVYQVAVGGLVMTETYYR